MIKNYIPFHQFKKIDESIVLEILDSDSVSIVLDEFLMSIDDMIESSEDGYYHNNECEIHFHLPKYNNELVTVFFEAFLSFYEKYDPGDYYQPPDCEILNENLDIYVKDIIMENYDVEVDLNSNEIKKLETFIENLLTD